MVFFSSLNIFIIPALKSLSAKLDLSPLTGCFYSLLFSSCLGHITLSCFFACLISFLLKTEHFRQYIVARLDTDPLNLIIFELVSLLL